MKLRLPKRRIWRVAIYLASTLLVLLAIDLIFVRIGQHITPGYDTTRITEPTMRDGSIDYLTAMENHFSEGVTRENNAAPLILEALGRAALPSNQPPNGITDRLGMPPLSAQGDYFQRLDAIPAPPAPAAGQAAKEKVDLEKLIDAIRASDNDRVALWTAVGDPHTAAWLAANEKPLAKLAEATKRPRYFIPYNGGMRPDNLAEILLPHLQLLRDSGRALVSRAMLKASQNDSAGAHDDLMTAHRLAGLLDRGPTLIDRLVGYVIDGAASSAEALLAVEQKVDPAQARRWLAELQQLPPVGAFADNLEYGERYLYLDLMQGSAHKGLAHLMDFFAGPDVHHPFIQWRWIWPLVPMQYSSAMHVGNTWYDRLVEAASKPAGPPRREAMSAVQKDWDVFWSQTRPWHVFTRSDWPIAATTPALFKFIDRADTTQAKRHLAIVALALAAHRGEHGDYPRQLDELKFAALAQIPLDPFTAKPLFYKPAKDGYLLYSVGPNLLDDQGKGDDVAVRAGASATTNP